MGLSRHRARLRLLSVAAVLAALATAGTVAGLSGGTPAAASRVEPAALVTEETAVPGAPNCPMFPADNIWNTDISKLPVDSRSAAWLRSMDSATTDLHPDFGPDQGGYPYGIPYAIVTSAHKTVRVKFRYAGQSNQVPYPLGPDTPIEGGQNAPADTDRHALIVNKSTCTLYELWQARYSAKGSTAGSGAVWNLRSDALRPAGWTSADAAGLPILPGLLNFAQIQQAVRTHTPITHAIRFTAQVTAGAYVWPARHEAGSGSSATRPPMGARFRLKAGFNVARLLPRVPAVLRGRQGGPGRNAALRAHPGRQRQQLVLRRHRVPAVAGRAGVTAQADSGPGLPGRRHRLPDGQPQIRPGPRPARLPDRLTPHRLTPHRLTPHRLTPPRRVITIF